MSEPAKLETVFTRSEIGWLREARLRAQPFYAKADKLKAQGTQITSDVFTEVLKKYRKLLKGRQWETLYDETGIPVGFRLLPEPHKHDEETEKKEPHA